MQQKGLLLYQRKQLHPFPSEVVESLIIRKGLLKCEANIDGSNVKDNELLLSCQVCSPLYAMAFVQSSLRVQPDSSQHHDYQDW